jgi:hypothetical protein
MKHPITIAALLLCAVSGAAQAQQAYEPPAAEAADPLDQPSADPLSTDQLSSLRDQEREEQDAARPLAERRERMIEECEDNHGSEIDCQREVDTELRAEGLQSGARVIHLSPHR